MSMGMNSVKSELGLGSSLIIRDWEEWESGKRPYPGSWGGIRPLGSLFIVQANECEHWRGHRAEPQLAYA